MQSKSKIGLILATILAVAAAAGAVWYWYYHTQTLPTPSTQPATPSQSLQDTANTDKHVIYEPEKVANPLLVGQWLKDDNKHYKVYLDDACDEESYFWGKEWDEAQNISEEDLTYHGNGWFKWSITHNELTEIYVSENGSILVPYQYRIDSLNDSTFVYTSFRITQTEYNQEKKVPFRTYHFHRL